MPITTLTNSGAMALADLHGSHEKAKAFRERDRLPPKDKNAKVAQRVLVMNDFHMSAGVDKETCKFHAAEEFTAKHARQFEAYMGQEWNTAKKNGYELTMCLNGDVLDFLQTSSEQPGLKYPDGFTPNGNAPENTPANVIVQLNIIYEGQPLFFRTLATHLLNGHKIDFVPGNHDRHLYNKHVWEGTINVGGKKIGGFVPIMAKEMAEMGASEKDITDALSRLTLKTFAIYGDSFVDHGDMADPFNRVQRPYGELLQPSGLHDVMPLAFGDYGVRDGFNQLEPLEPRLNSSNRDQVEFWFRSLKHPIQTSKMMLGFARGSLEEGYSSSTKAELDQRVADMRALVDKFPFITESLNALRPQNDQLSDDAIKEGLEAIERKSATPLFSNFAKSDGFFKRIYKLVCHGIEPRREPDILKERMEQANNTLGLNNFVHGHTHRANVETYITDNEKTINHVDTHTWMDRHGDWGRGYYTFGEEGRGVGVIETGENSDGSVFCSATLQKVNNEQGELVQGDIFAAADLDKEPATQKMKKIYENSHPDKFMPVTEDDYDSDDGSEFWPAYA